MRTRPDLVAPAPWSNGPLTIFHGTVLTHWLDIARDGVRVGRGRLNTDFGRGFYATADLRQATGWAVQLATRYRDTAAVATAQVSRENLASLESLCFVRGHEDAADFWSFVHSCRVGAETHARPHLSKPMYDVVVGPVALNYRRRDAYENMDQISFHTRAAEDVLNGATWSRI